MSMFIIPIILLIILLLFFLLFLMLNKKQENKYNTMKKEEKKDFNKSNIVKNDKNEKTNEYKKEDVFRFMEFDKILNNMIVQNNGSRFTMAIKCKGINYDLMSEVEQLSVEEGFITFLNTLKYPIQFYIQAQDIDLKSVIENYRENIVPLANKYDEVNKEYVKLASSFDVDEKKLEGLSKERESINNVYEYANDMINYVEKLNGNKNLLQRNFYVLVSYSTAEISAADKFNKDELIEMCFTELSTRCNSIISALSSCSVSGTILNSNELADLLYSAYNRDDRGLINVKEALDSGIFRLYSTSEDAIYKKTIALDDYLKTEAKIKALETMKYVIEHDEIETPASQAISEREEISKRATTMVKNEDYDVDFKNKVNSKILSDFREEKKELLELDKLQKEELIETSNRELEELDELKNREKPEGIKLIEKSKEYKESIDSNDEVRKISNNEKEKIDITEEINDVNLYSKNDNENENEEDESIL